MSFLLPNLLHFTRLLRTLGLDVQAARTLDVAQGLEHIEIGRRQDFYHTLRALLVHRPQDLPIFDEAFRVFWRRPPADWSTQDLRAMGEHRRAGRPQVEAPTDEPVPGRREGGGAPAAGIEQVAALSYSAREVLRAKDFTRYTEEELLQAKRMMAEFRWQIGMRRTRRWTAGRGGRPDLRRVIRVNLPYGGELVDVPSRRRKERRRPLVLICDVSGSMERYTRILLHFLYCVAGRLDRVEVFLFATRLTRITRQLERRAVDDVVSRLPRQVPDFAGGTRIGGSLRSFNVTWARRVLGRGPLVLLISDGWDRGEPELLRTEMARLQRSAHRLIWLNPLMGSPDYAPLTRGMQAALPFVDDFLPVHNLASLDALAQHLNALPPRRPARAQSRRVLSRTVRSQVGRLPEDVRVPTHQPPAD